MEPPEIGSFGKPARFDGPASDILVGLHSELDPALPLRLLALAGRVDRAVARAGLVERVPVEGSRALRDVVIDVVHRRTVG